MITILSFCLDIDECLSPDNGCEQICNNTVGSYVCSCMNGFTLNADGRTCDGIVIQIT